MLTSTTISRRQSEIREILSTLAGKETPTADETRSMAELDTEYRTNETRYRAALIAEDTERRAAGAELETRSDREFSELISGFELRQVVLALDEGKALSGQTAEVVTELRSAGGYRGIPIPLMALEQRAGETIAAGTPDPIQTRPIIDRLFPSSVAAQMGVQMIQIGSGAVEWPVTTSAVTAGWAPSELGNVPGPTTYATTDKALKPDHNLGIHMRISRRAMLQSGAALEQAIRRDMSGTISAELDKAIFLGTGADGQPLGIIPGAATYGINTTAIGAAASWAAFRAAVVRFMTANAANGPGSVNLLMRPEVWAYYGRRSYHRHGCFRVGSPEGPDWQHHSDHQWPCRSYRFASRHQCTSHHQRGRCAPCLCRPLGRCRSHSRSVQRRPVGRPSPHCPDHGRRYRGARFPA